MVLKSVLRDVLRGPSHDRTPLLSVIVNFYNNRREARNTLYSLTRAYQRDAEETAFEVIAIDNGSSQPLSEEDVVAFGPEFQYRFVQTNSRSPVQAVNMACMEALGERLMIVIDGAHILSPGIYRLARKAFSSYRSPFVATPLFHLGPKVQNQSVAEGYNQQMEDGLLDGCGWKANGYSLYSIAGALADGSGGWYGRLFESGCISLRKADFLALGGYDERFQSPGGGFASLDLFQRALACPDLQYVMLLGEGTFHQVHGGVATNAAPERHPWNDFREEYARIRGHPFVRVPRKPFFLGDFPPEARPMAEISKDLGEAIWGRPRS